MKLFEAIDARHEEIARFRPFSDGNLQEQIRAFSRLEVTCSSNAIEGSSCTLLETKVLLEDGLTAGGKPLVHALAAEGHARAWDYMFSLLHADAVSEENLLFMHGLLQGLEIHAVPICYRKAPVFVTGSRHVPPDFRLVPGAMKRLVEGQGRLFAKCHPVAAAKFHKELAFIHPFADGNGRIARLAMELPSRPAGLSSRVHSAGSPAELRPKPRTRACQRCRLHCPCRAG
jgi:Fic family protein